MNARESLSATFLTSAVALALLLLTALITIPPLLVAAFGRSAADTDPAETIASLVETHDERMSVYQNRFNGRSVFFRPPAPAPPPRTEVRNPDPEPEVEQPPPPPPPVPSAPATYQGPAVSVVLGDKVMFKGPSSRDGGQWISVGEEVNGLKVLETNAPRSVRVSYQRGEYDVPVFNWDMPFFLDSAQAREPVSGLIVTPSASPQAPPPSPTPNQSRGRARAVATPPEIVDPPVDDEQTRQREQQQNLSDVSEPQELENFHPAGEPDVPPFDPDYDPDFQPDEDVEESADDESGPEAEEQDAVP